ncbi:transposase [Rhodococcus rhodnii LMG 5362]|uniref:Transposase n=1 Tax=Rhodococcus rhodnii LMG 5362 TaxID=1273125 RepID=R7WH19_9NOCA|nr:transposase [Rhodococcus rhodnii LMG 5362]
MWALIAPDFLTLLSWSAHERVVQFPADHPLLGWSSCVVASCDFKAHTSNGLCAACMKRWKDHGEPPIDEFMDEDRPTVRVGYGLCIVSPCQRPWRSRGTALCASHHHRRTRVLKVSMEEFLAHPDVFGLASFGPCAVAACTRDRESSSGPYCINHQLRWVKIQRQPESVRRSSHDIDEQWFRRTNAAIPVGTECSLRGLPDRVAAELLYGLSRRTANGVKTRADQFRPLVAHLLEHQLSSVEEVVLTDLRQGVKIVCSNVLTEVRRVRLTPESERAKDEWDVSVFGYNGTLRFQTISQPWLREATKTWAYNELPRRHAKTTKQLVQGEVNVVGMLSESLRLQRPGDRGDDPRLLSRSDIAGFLNRLMFLHAGGTMSDYARMTTVQTLRRVLARMRSLGLTAPGQPLHGLPDDFTLAPEDVPPPGERDTQHRDVPVEVMRHICARLDDLEKANTREIRVAVELLIDTGRRPDEICQLGLDCLDRDEQGKPVLVYTNFKANRLGRRLPITEATAAVITAQQDRVRDRFPNEPAGKVILLPAPTRNPHGHRPISDDSVSWQHRKWILSPTSPSP